jgi:hypothetical protein
VRAEDVHILPPQRLGSAEVAMCGATWPVRLTVLPERGTCTECRARWRARVEPAPPLSDGDLVA